MILIISKKSDQHADRVESILQKNAADYSSLKLDIDSLKSTQIKFEDNALKIEGPNCNFSTNEIESVWNRGTLIDPFMDDYNPPDKDNLIRNEQWNKMLEKLFLLLESTKQLNFFHDFYSDTQFRHYAISKNIGLKWPSSICTNDINYLNSFFESKKERILDLMYQDRKMNISGEWFGTDGEKAGNTRPDKIPVNRRQVSAFTFQVRCTVVGKEYFVGKIKSNTNHESQNTKQQRQNYTVFQPPKAIRMQAIQIMTELNLTHGVFDFIVTDKDEWFFDTLNPIEQYQWIEDMKGSDISSSIAKWLMINN
jgi:hypothetical protein